MSWTKSLADHPDLVAEYAVSEHLSIHDTTTVHAPCCGARVSADMVMDVRGLPGTVLNGGPVSGRDMEWACDACLTRLFREDRTAWTRSKFMQAQGAPPGDVRVERAKELARQEKRRLHRNNQSANWQEIYERQLADLPEVPDIDIPEG